MRGQAPHLRGDDEVHRPHHDHCGGRKQQDAVPSPQEEREEANRAHSRFSSQSFKNDHLMIVTVFNKWQVVRQEGGYKKARAFCTENYLSFSSLEGIHALRADYARSSSSLGL